MLRGLAIGLFEHERIATTRARSKVVRGYAERLISQAKRGIAEKATPEQLLRHKREVMRSIHQRAVVKKLFEDIAPRFKDRQGGYTRIIHLPDRISDSSKMSIIELVERREKVQRAKVAKKSEKGTEEQMDGRKIDRRKGQEKARVRQKRWFDRILGTRRNAQRSK